jgi:N-acetylated-alpha-linked acidic dipeptidase
VARDIVDPETKLSVWKRAQLKSIADATSPEELRDVRERRDLRIDMLGGGSDHVAFLNFAGIASLGIEYGGEDPNSGVYHSSYDDFYWYTHFGDHDFAYGRALCQTGGIAVMRMADADILPFEFSDFADEVKSYVRELKKYAVHQREEIQATNQKIQEGVYQATIDPQQTLVVPAKQEIPPYLNFAPLDNAVEALGRSSDEYQRVFERFTTNPGAAPLLSSLKQINELLIQSERRLTAPEGLPGRFWYKHELYAPGAYTGYSAKAMPAVQESLELKKWTDAEHAAARIAQVLLDETALISDATAKVSSLTK